MFDSERPDQYEIVYRELVERLAEADLATNAEKLGLPVREGAVEVPLLGSEYIVSADGVRRSDGSEAQLTHRIVLAHFLLFGGSGEPSGEFVPYRELRGGCDFSRNLAITVEGRLARGFSGRAEGLRRAAAALGATPHDTGTSYDVCVAVPALPVIPLMFAFYDSDEDFPAEVKLFFDSNAQAFLDLECLAVLGMILVTELESATV